MFARLIANLFFGLSFSVCGTALITAIGLITNLPRILTGLGMIGRLILRFSFYLYHWILSLVQPLFETMADFDLQALVPRTLLSLVLSVVLGNSLLILLGWNANPWWLILFGIHGLLVGQIWTGIIEASEFQMGDELT